MAIERKCSRCKSQSEIYEGLAQMSTDSLAASCQLLSEMKIPNVSLDQIWYPTTWNVQKIQTWNKHNKVFKKWKQICCQFFHLLLNCLFLLDSILDSVLQTWQMIDIASKIGSCSCWFENYTQKVSLSEEYAKSALKPTCVYVGVSFDCTPHPPPVSSSWILEKEEEAPSKAAVSSCGSSLYLLRSLPLR